MHLILEQIEAQRQAIESFGKEIKKLQAVIDAALKELNRDFS